ncbi:UNVERIFIED_CONTAM: hypothetical protein RMT77_017321 [Armadillidium vulgare]
MNFKSEIEIKGEELDLEYDFGNQTSQVFSNLAEGIKNEGLNEKASIKSELRKSEKGFMFDEKLVNNDIQSKNLMMIEKENLKKFTTLANVSSLLKKINDKCLDKHFESDEERFFAELVKSKSPSVLLKKLSHKELKALLGDVFEVENGSKMKSTSRSKPLTSVTRDQSIEENHLEIVSCRFCNFRFKGQAELKSHLKTHEKRKFKCDHCSYEHNSKSLLKQHLLIHSNVKLFKCSVCSYECNRKGMLKSHMLTHSNINLFKCCECNFECNRKGSLKRQTK